MNKNNYREIPFGRPILGDEERTAVSNVLSGHILTHGPRCAEFEERFAEMLGVKHAITVSSCTTALHLSLMALGVGPGDEVVVPAETHVATAHAVEHCGAKPVFVDVDRHTGNIEPSLIEAALNEKTKAIIVVHYLGLPCEMDRIMSIADAHGVRVVEDCALAVGADFAGRAPGSIGATGCFSFYPTKHMTTMEGGMLTTNDDDVAFLVRKQRAFGYDKGLGERSTPGVYDVVMLGYNFRMSEGQAAIGTCQLDRLPGFLEQRRANSDRLIEQIATIDDIIVFPVNHGEAHSSRYCVNVMLPEDGSIDRGRVIKALNEAGVGTSVHYPVALPYATFYREKYGVQEGAFPVARWISSQAISLPCGPHLDLGDMDYIASKLPMALAQGR